jgi:hypothetical protein
MEHTTMNIMETSLTFDYNNYAKLSTVALIDVWEKLDDTYHALKGIDRSLANATLQKLEAELSKRGAL